MTLLSSGSSEKDTKLFAWIFPHTVALWKENRQSFNYGFISPNPTFSLWERDCDADWLGWKESSLPCWGEFSFPPFHKIRTWWTTLCFHLIKFFFVLRWMHCLHTHTHTYTGGVAYHMYTWIGGGCWFIFYWVSFFISIENVVCYILMQGYHLSRCKSGNVVTGWSEVVQQVYGLTKSMK